MDSKPLEIHRSLDKHVQNRTNIKMDKIIPLGADNPRNPKLKHRALLLDEQERPLGPTFPEPVHNGRQDEILLEYDRMYEAAAILFGG